MLYSQLFGKTNKGAPRGAKAVSHKLLSRGGFIRKSTAGRYYFLPLGWRVHKKIEAVIREEMEAAGAQEMMVPILHPLSLWQETGRTEEVSFELMRVKTRSGAEYALGGTAEEMFVDLVRKLKLSYKDLPFNVYQFSSKFRDELRFRGGLLRVREFFMKDAYSFDENEAGFKKQYQKMADAYRRIFSRLGLKETMMVEADSGYIGGDYCHEFVYPSPSGEDVVFACDHCQYRANLEKARAALEPKNPKEKVKKFKIIKQPAWVCTMKDNVRHYGEPLWRYLKNVVYVDEKGRIIIASIRGDQEVNETKLKKAVGAKTLRAATEKDLKKIGARSGWVHSWEHKGAFYIGDRGLKMVKNFIGGYKKEDSDAFNVNYGRDFSYPLADIVNAKEGDLCPVCRHGRLKKIRGIEVGHIFQLGYHYTKKMKGAVFVDRQGREKPFYMGCYGIGLGRLMATAVKASHDERGIIWPKEIAPFNVHLITLQDREEEGEEIYQRLKKEGIEVLWDDREDVSAGEKFADADLIGVPVRLVISQKTGSKIEWKERSKEEITLLQYNEVIRKLKS